MTWPFVSILQRRVRGRHSIVGEKADKDVSLEGCASIKKSFEKRTPDFNHILWTYERKPPWLSLMATQPGCSTSSRTRWKCESWLRSLVRCTAWNKRRGKFSRETWQRNC